MSNPNDDSNKEPIKPISKGLKIQVQRTVSAGVTLENTSENVNSNTTTDSEISKLRVSAIPFVPKHRRTETAPTGSTTGTTTAPQKETITTEGLNSSQTTTGGNSIPISEPANFNQQGSYIPYTYLNTPGMYGTHSHMQPNINMFPQNKPAGGQFYAGYTGMQPMPGIQMPPTMPYGQYPMYTGQPKYHQPMGRMPLATTTPVATTQEGASTATTATTTYATANYNTADSKKSSFNKNAQPFYPKNFKSEPSNVSSVEVEKSEAKAEAKDEVKPVDNTEEKIESVDKEQIKAEELKETITQAAEEVIVTKSEEPKVFTATITTPTQAVTVVAEPVKPEKKTKLGNLFDSSPSTAPAFKTKVQAKDATKVQKPIGAGTTTVKTKQNDKNKYFDEMSKKLQADKLKAQTEVKVSKPVSIKKDTAEKEIELESKEEFVQKEQEQIKEKETKIGEDEQITKANLEKSSEEQDLKQTIERHYFIVDESVDKKSDAKHVYSVDYMLSFKDWRICKEDKLLTEMLQDHIKLMNTVSEEERHKSYKNHSKRDSKPSNLRQSQHQSQSTTDTSKTFERKPEKDKEELKRQSATTSTVGATEGLGKWGRKDMSEGEKLANEFKVKLDEERKRDPVRNDLIELLNILTVDNYDEVKRQIYEIIKGDVEDQGKFLEVLFKKAVHEKAFVLLYSRLCKDLDRELPQKSDKVADKTVGGKLATRPSIMRSKLLDKCKEIFKTDQDSKVDQYIKVSDPEEREAKMKKFLLGNVNFIGELINTKLLSKKIVFQCLNNLFSRVEKSDELSVFFKQINIEAIVILMDKFGTLINKYETKTKPEELMEFTKRIDEYLNKLDHIATYDKDIPGYIRYKIINLIEKKNRGWEESKVDKTVLAQGKNQIKEDIETELNRTSSNIKGAGRLDQSAVNNKIRDDLYSWREHVKAGYEANHYNWDITDTLVKKNKNTIGEILTAFGETCIDFINKTEDINYAYLYIREIITYFFKRLTLAEKNEINQVTLFWLENINDFAIDNSLLINIWGATIYLLDYFNIFSFADIDKLTNLSDDQLKAIFEVIKLALGYYEDKEAKTNELLNIPIFQANKALFLSIVKDSN